MNRTSSMWGRVSVVAAALTVLLAAQAFLFAADEDSALIQLGKPERFTAEEQQKLDDTIDALKDVQERLLTHELSEKQIQVMSEQAQRYALEINLLQNRKTAWNEYLLVHPEGRTPADPDSAIGPPTASRSPFDYAGFFKLLKTFSESEEKLAKSQNTLSPQAWEGLGKSLSTYASVAFQPRGDAVAPYVLRAALLTGECYLNASVLYFKGNKRAEQMKAYKQGIAYLERVIRVSYMGDEEQLGTLPLTHADAPDGTYFWAGCWKGNIEEHSQVTSTYKARKMLADFCPWGVPAWTFLDAAGFAQLINFKILHPYGDDEADRLQEASLRSNIPVHIKRDTEKFVAGDFDWYGQRTIVPWVAPPRATYSVWFMSPRVFDMSPAERLAWGLRFFKLVNSGAMDLLVDETINFCLKHVELQLGSESYVYGASGMAVDANNMGFDSDFLIDGKPFNQFKLYKEVLMKVISGLEKKEMELLFDTLDPKEPALLDFSGRPSSYDDSRVPPVIIRADAMAFEKLPDCRYPRSWHMVRYYQFDPRGPTGVDNYDLFKRDIGTVPSTGNYLAGDLVANVKTWPLMRWQPKPWGYRIYISDFSPNGQVICVKFSNETLENWKERLPKEETVFAVLEDPNGNIITMTEVTGTQVRVHLRNGRIHLKDQPAGIANPSGPTCMLMDMFKRYSLRITSGEKTADGWRVSSSSADFFSANADFAGRPGKAFAGRISSPMRGWIQLDYDVDAPIDIDPKPSMADPFPPILRVDGVKFSGAKVEQGPYDQKEFTLNASIAPAPGDMITLAIKVNGRVYYLYDKTGRIAAGALFYGKIPLERGENKFELVSSVPNTRFAFTTQRKEPQALYDPAKEEETIIGLWKEMEEFRKQDKPYGYYTCLRSMLSNYHFAARSAYEAGQFALAKQYLDKYFAQFPQRAAVEATDFNDQMSSLDESRMFACETMMKVAFAQADAAALATAGMQYFAANRKYQETNYAPVTTSYFNSTADKIGVFVNQLIMCKADAGTIKKAISLYGEFRRLGGHPVEAQYEYMQFVFPEGGAK